MTINIINIPGPTANSFVDLDEANIYLEAHLQASDWASFDDEQKKAALISASRELNQLQFAGRRATQEQTLVWPRIGIVDYDGYAVTGIPQSLKDAICELAIYRLTADDRLASDFELENLTSVEIGPVKYAVRAGATTGLPPIVRSLLNSIGPSATEVNKSAKVMVL